VSRHDFSAAEFADRRARVRAALREADLDWLIAIHPISIHWLTGSEAKSYQEFQCLIVSAHSDALVILAREGERNELLDDALVNEVHGFGGGIAEDPIEAFATLARRIGVFQGRVGLEVPAYYLHPHHYERLKALLGPALVAEPTALVAGLKMVKSAAELGYIREAARRADLAMERFAAALREGESELSLAAVVHDTLLRADSMLAASPINLVSGERACYSHGAPTPRRLCAGEHGSIEYGATCRRYTATIGRQFSLGPPGRRLQEVYDVVRRAADACIGAIRDGVKATVPHEAACAVIAEAGLAHGRVHLSGYGLAPGFPPGWSEPVHLFDANPYVLRAGMVVTVEPPVFLHEERIGVRIIDNVLLTEGGAELLSRVDRGIIVAR
jgi:Xaa-Pro dipeptidase